MRAGAREMERAPIGRIEPIRLRAPRPTWVRGETEGLAYRLALPARLDPERPLLVAVHGLSRNVGEQCDAFGPLARRTGLALLVPEFDRATFRDFQRLGRIGRGRRADRALDAAVAAVQEQLGLRVPELLLFGYSGGGQFVHRYLMAHPGRVRAAVVAAPGWFTFPDRHRSYPHGLRVDGSLEDTPLRLRRFLRVPVLVAVGGADTARDESLRTSPRIDRVQGAHRLERARRWAEAMNREALRRGLAPPVSLRVLDDVGHSFAEAHAAGLGAIALDFLTQHIDPPSPTPPPSKGCSR